ncbi:adenosylcobinamide kinase /adenosylcobinamide-phosphate guanylyltransferase [Rhodovulum imhoffii]|uniref:Bifunctional adenosylcobalamin biosynthesis protein n=1 Tax=Rhodovulum imhoffii TaxID=365340 RepID=A0A2T5BPQ6_9RHOB|nr:bifunctional adenosylcobinamide kinase/adenosylcobinamide-phosphate guanylyltransferase [Rhodovulum imhoffii]MBK5933602.1 bifunctional adenosylcobinamide kinase/adenosylcobinamide-phosphate guanylyltransferase [Rhodovulum imhoffii]PTN01041.1 adenosylcobinamide kinase /adenosylcobinamide-phosphate guanylyltransferase [Rhodovulum imhoffii]
MAPIIFITGGARSGKSTRAEARIREFGGPRVYIATSRPEDDEMRARIAAHVAQRGPGWRTVEEPLDLPGALRDTDGDGGPCLVDCLTLWLSNLMWAKRDWAANVAALEVALEARQNPVVLVSNEVGMGIVPENALARAFRDAQGRLNQRIAACADEVELVVSGLPLRVK